MGSVDDVPAFDEALAWCIIGALQGDKERLAADLALWTGGNDLPPISQRQQDANRRARAPRYRREDEEELAHEPTTPLAQRVVEELRRDARRRDPVIAEAAGCSPNYVGVWRRRVVV